MVKIRAATKVSGDTSNGARAVSDSLDVWTIIEIQSVQVDPFKAIDIITIKLKTHPFHRRVRTRTSNDSMSPGGGGGGAVPDQAASGGCRFRGTT